jgi:integrase
MPCSVKLLRVPKASATSFYDFDDYERLVAGAKVADSRAYLLVLLGAEAGLRSGEMVALEWTDIDLARGRLCVQRSAWRGQVSSPKGGRLRYVPLTNRLAAALRGHRHLRGAAGAVSRRRLTSDPGCREGLPQAGRSPGRTRGGRPAQAAALVLLTPGDARRAGPRDPGTRRASGPLDVAAVHAPESRGDRARDPVARSACFRTKLWRHFGNGEGRNP